MHICVVKSEKSEEVIIIKYSREWILLERRKAMIENMHMKGVHYIIINILFYHVFFWSVLLFEQLIDSTSQPLSLSDSHHGSPCTSLNCPSPATRQLLIAIAPVPQSLRNYVNYLIHSM